jgi:hypothetical protein
MEHKSMEQTGTAQIVRNIYQNNKDREEFLTNHKYILKYTGKNTLI